MASRGARGGRARADACARLGPRPRRGARPSAPGGRSPRSRERGSQALELALLLPLVALLLAVVAIAAISVAELVAAQSLARDAARAAAAGEDPHAVVQAAGRGDAELRVEPSGEVEPGAPVRVELAVPLRGAAVLGLEQHAPAAASMPAEP